ncbi:DUF4041 domain-containing protein [Pseudomonas chlororaphis]|uniref:Predicted HD superfamily hydrolase n=1 Tax=Pseudomonas chlororaphis TaxID=587753 RepID=A0AAX3FSM0_9PSED|nr:DUF4041 domain-containing protein [Pseudomonas chlororaphis]AZC37788.1 Chromosome segregation ATPase [Pseudomonas chlororaphis subsp. piscium]AZC44336.1 Chromosome segregation ATPase [Pseudomonas chlororaphis subsp. piscium]WDG69976.1 DUF4041 domain-containing protein [Pseudomonas chlororaphis]WDH26197.1 DUF4041 domain-containing protein [Pseudomonas chlororaphis]WDH68502.1 DUF4041 domain-containing protein [Pseudomonas chlororaphis]
MEFLALIAGITAFVFLVKSTKAKGLISQLKMELAARQNDLKVTEEEATSLRQQLQLKLKELERFKDIVDAEAEAARILGETKSERSQLLQQAQSKVDQAESRLKQAIADAEKIIASAQERAEQVAGDALAAMGKAKHYTDAAQAMKNIIDGYGDAYIVPTYNLLDDLAEEFGFTEAGQKLKAARDFTRQMVKTGRAAACDYVETNRRETALRFVVDAFNGKVDSILSRSKSDNHGKLEQEIRDAAALVNLNGAPFRNARITEDYLVSRLEELRWAVTTKLLKDQEREEQRQLREQIREEEKARREYERAIKEAAKEEATLRKALEKAQEQVAAASAAERAEFEARLALLQQQLQAAEDKNQRALSMAQQTRAGHVYVISNIGSFGEQVFKIGMTRRLEPLDRVRELGDASVPFEFDVHAMIFSDDAPGLEKQLHRHFLREQVNKVNPRKEFFRIGLPAIRAELEELGVETQWTMSAKALEFKETQRIEQQIIENPAIAAEWTRHQLEVEEAIEQSEEEALATA